MSGIPAPRALRLIALLALVVLADWLTPAEFDVYVLYVLSVMYASWEGGRLYGGAFAAAAAISIALQVMIHEGPYSTSFFAVVSLANKIIILPILVWVICRARLLHYLALEGSRQDPLTGLPNRRTILERLALEFHRSKRTRNPYVFAYIDLDGFKQINDRLGHRTGDEVLIAVAGVLSTHVRPSDMAARLGGDEFCVLLADTSLPEGRIVIDRLREDLRQVMAGRQWSVAASIGLVSSARHFRTVDELIASADELMLQAKRQGKDRVAEEDAVHMSSANNKTPHVVS